MVLAKIFAISLLAFANAAVSPELTDSPTDVTLKASFNKTIEGSVAFSSKNGSVLVDVDLSGLPLAGGPYQYHIHVKPVPTNGSCVATLGHFNPYDGSVNATENSEKEAGDLSGKHGLITGTSLKTTYIDPYLSLNPLSKSYFGGLSVVVHYKNSTRLACANITEVAHSVTPGSGGSILGAGLAVPLVAGAAALLV